MTIDKGIPIKNIYYMMAYAFRALRSEEYKKVLAEEFKNAEELMAAIFSISLSGVIKCGLYKEYVNKSESLPRLVGKLDINQTIKNRINSINQLGCEYDELTENNLINQIVKSTVIYVLNRKLVTGDYLFNIKKNIPVLTYVDEIAPSEINWNRLTYNKSNARYELLLNMCYFLLKGYIYTTEDGKYKSIQQADSQAMHMLYEKFILEYYRFHHPEFNPNPTQISWNVEGDLPDYFPKMISDITMSYRGKTVIIDAKYYESIYLSHHNKDIFRTSHMYQIFAYVKNYDCEHTGKVKGILLYAGTGEYIDENANTFVHEGNTFEIAALDLSADFYKIEEQLEEHAKYLLV